MRLPLTVRFAVSLESVTGIATLFSVDRLLRKPVCTLVKTEFFSRYHTSLLATKRSITLQSVVVSAFGLYEFESSGSLPPLGKGSTIACLQLFGAFPFAKPHCTVLVSAAFRIPVAVSNTRMEFRLPLETYLIYIDSELS